MGSDLQNRMSSQSYLREREREREREPGEEELEESIKVSNVPGQGTKKLLKFKPIPISASVETESA